MYCNFQVDCNKHFYRTTIVQDIYICSVQISNNYGNYQFSLPFYKDKANLHLRLLYRFNDTDFVIEQIPSLKLKKTTE
jgi:hypothetical protein